MAIGYGINFVKALLDDAEWSHRLDKAQTNRDVQRVIREFARAKGYKITEIKF